MNTTQKIAYYKALQILKEDGTYDSYNKLNYQDGYQVATTNNGYSRKLKALNKIVKLGGRCGIWTDKEHNKIYVDESRYVKNKSYARQLQKKFNQQCVWDWAKKDTI